MAKNLTNYKVFIASPRGLEKEREFFKDTINEFNTFEANHRNIHFSAIGWEITLGGIGRPQSQINEEIEDCDFFILLLHDKWGTPPENPLSKSKFTSGTEEEFYLAYDCYKNEDFPMKQIVLFFKGVNERQLNDPGAELKKVLAFRAKREKEKDFLYETFDTADNFKDILRRHLSAWVRNHENGKILKQPDKKFSRRNEEFIYPSYEIDFKSDENINLILEKADSLVKEGKILEAELIFSQLSVRSEAPKPMIRHARFLRKIGQPQRALEILNKALEKSLIVNDQNNMAYSHRQIGRSEEVRGYYEVAESHYNKALDLYRFCNDKKGIAKTLRDLGMVQRRMGCFKKAIVTLKEALEIYELTDDDNGIATAYGCLGLIYKTEGNLDKAEESHRKALKIHEKFSNKEAKAIVLSNLGVILRLKNKLQEAYVLHSKSLEVFLELNNKKGVAREYSNLGVIQRLLGEYSNAREKHKKSLIISEQLGNQDGMAIQYGNLGIIARFEKKYNESEEFHRKSLAISNNIGDKIGQSIQYQNLGILYRERNELDKSIELIQRAMDISLESKNKFGAAITHFEMAKTLCLKNKKLKALEYADKSLNIFNNLNIVEDEKKVKGFIKKCNEGGSVI